MLGLHGLAPLPMNRTPEPELMDGLEQAQAYAAADFAAGDQALIERLAQLFPGGLGARLVDLGCGPGGASAHMRDAGLNPDPVDASPAMIALAKERFSLEARQATFDDIGGEALYDAIWANFSLLHAPRADLSRHFTALARVLRPGGLFHVGLKTGTGEARDEIGRAHV